LSFELTLSREYQASKLQQALEESNTANILLCLGEKNDNPPEAVAAMNDLPVTETANPNLTKGNIIDQLRNIVRAEAAIFLKPKFESSFQQLLSNASAVSADTNTSTSSTTNADEEDVHDSDDDEADGDLIHPSSASFSTKTWKDGQLVSDKGNGDDVDAIR
jgi:hypothetical protein